MFTPYVSVQAMYLQNTVYSIRAYVFRSPQLAGTEATANLQNIVHTLLAYVYSFLFTTYLQKHYALYTCLCYSLP